MPSTVSASAESTSKSTTSGWFARTIVTASATCLGLADHLDTVVVVEQRADSCAQHRMLIDDEELDRARLASHGDVDGRPFRPALFSCHGSSILRTHLARAWPMEP